MANVDHEVRGGASPITIKAASEADIPDVIGIAEQWQLRASLDPKSGFLVSAFSETEYRDYLTRARYFLVAKRENTVVGFIIAYTNEEMNSDEAVNARMVEEIGPLLIIKQVAVHSGHARSGVAQRLYDHVLSSSGELPVIAAVVTQPSNVASTRFHYAAGFEPFKRLQAPDGRERMIWLHRGRSRDLLLYQYRHAVDLYKHEDSLNWNKLNNLLVISGALFTAYGFVIAMKIRSTVDTPFNVLAWTVCTVGLTVATGFLVSLLAGIQYLHARKNSAARLEEVLVKLGGTRLVSIKIGNSNHALLRKSPTRYLLRAVPIVLIGAWCAALAAALLLR